MDPALHSLPLFHRIAGACVVVIGDGEMAAAKRRLIERAGGICCGEDEDTGARIAFVAVEGRAEAERIAARLKASGLLVNVADRPELCDFTLPSILERGDVLVAVSTGGASAGLAKHLRLRLEQVLPPSLAALASGLAAARGAIRARWSDGAERRRALDAALGDGGALDPLAADAAPPGDRIAAWLDGAREPERGRTVLLTLASDDPDDLTLRQARLLGAADRIIHERDLAPAILARARADAARQLLDDPAGSPPTDEPPSGLTLILRRGRA